MRQIWREIRIHQEFGNGTVSTFCPTRVTPTPTPPIALEKEYIDASTIKNKAQHSISYVK